MAYRVTKKLIIDTQDKSIGVSDCMTRGNNGYFAVNYSTKEQIKSDLRNLILTNRGERLGVPDFGCDLRRVIFEQDGPDAYAYIQNEIQNSISTWLPFITVNSIDIISDNESRDNNRIDVQLNYTTTFAGDISRDSINIRV